MAIMKAKQLPKYGDEGLEVVKFQKLLQKTGSTIKVNGRFTIGMVSAIKCFQKKFSLKVTGKLDKKTADALAAFKPARPPRRK